MSHFGGQNEKLRYYSAQRSVILLMTFAAPLLNLKDERERQLWIVVIIKDGFDQVCVCDQRNLQKAFMASYKITHPLATADHATLRAQCDVTP